MIVRSALVKVGHRQTNYMKNPLVQKNVQGGFCVDERNTGKNQADSAPASPWIPLDRATTALTPLRGRRSVPG